MFGWFRKKKPAAVDQHEVACSRPQRCPLNVAGPFYTLGTCLACEAPEAEAPDLLAALKDGNYTTYFVKQPATPEEVERACNAIQVCCVMDLRYGGTNPAIIERLGNNENACDHVIRDGQLVRSEKAAAEPKVAPDCGGIT